MGRSLPFHSSPACAVLACLLATSAHAADRGQRFAADSARVLAMAGRARADSVEIVLADDIAAARRARDRALLARALTLEAGVWSGSERPARALAVLDECVALADAVGDSALLARAVRSRCYALGQAGRYAEQERDASRLLVLA